MNENEITNPTTPQPEATPAATTDNMPVVDTGATMTGQEAIEEKFAAEQDAEIAAIQAELEASGDENGGTAAPDEGNGARKDGTPAPADTGKGGTAAPADGATPPAETKGGGESTEDAIAKARLDAERAAAGRFGGKMQQLEQENARLRGLLEQRNAAPAPTEPQPPVAETDPTDADLERLLGKDWQESWGHDGAVAEFKRLQRAAQLFGGGASVKDAVHKEVDAVLDAERRAGNLDRFWQELEREVPGANKVNDEAKTNGFGAYLQGYQPGTVTKRADIANSALDLIESGEVGESRDAAVKVLAEMFRGFLGAKAPEKATERTVAPKPIDPKRYVAPTSTGASPATGGGGKTYTRAAINQFLERAEAKGEEAFQKAFAWVCEQENLGTITD